MYGVERAGGDCVPIRARLLLVPERDQIVFFKILICTGARRNPTTRGTNQGNSKSDLPHAVCFCTTTCEAVVSSHLPLKTLSPSHVKMSRIL